MFLTIVVFLGVLMATCTVALAVIPRFDRRSPLAPLRPALAAVGARARRA